MFIALCHLGCLVLLITGLDAAALVWVLLLYGVRMLAITAVLHRLIAHRSYDAPRWFWWLGALVATSAGQMGPNWWAAHHQQHHRHVDSSHDPHTPLQRADRWRGFWHAHMGWLLTPDFHPDRLPADLEADPVLRLLDRLHLLPPLALAWVSWQLGGLPWLAAFCLSLCQLNLFPQALAHLVAPLLDGIDAGALLRCGQFESCQCCCCHFRAPLCEWTGQVCFLNGGKDNQPLTSPFNLAGHAKYSASFCMVLFAGDK